MDIKTYKSLSWTNGVTQKSVEEGHWLHEIRNRCHTNVNTNGTIKYEVLGKLKDLMNYLEDHDLATNPDYEDEDEAEYDPYCAETCTFSDFRRTHEIIEAVVDNNNLSMALCTKGDHTFGFNEYVPADTYCVYFKDKLLLRFNHDNLLILNSDLYERIDFQFSLEQQQKEALEKQQKEGALLLLL